MLMKIGGTSTRRPAPSYAAQTPEKAARNANKRKNKPYKGLIIRTPKQGRQGLLLKGAPLKGAPEPLEHDLITLLKAL